MLTFAEQHVQGDEDHVGRHRGELLVAHQLLQDTHAYATAVLNIISYATYRDEERDADHTTRGDTNARHIS